MPIIVAHKMSPINALATASSIPEAQSQSIFRRSEKTPPSSTISLPNGLSDIDESLKNAQTKADSLIKSMR